MLKIFCRFAFCALLLVGSLLSCNRRQPVAPLPEAVVSFLAQLDSLKMLEPEAARIEEYVPTLLADSNLPVARSGTCGYEYTRHERD